MFLLFALNILTTQAKMDRSLLSNNDHPNESYSSHKIQRVKQDTGYIPYIYIGERDSQSSDSSGLSAAALIFILPYTVIRYGDIANRLFTQTITPETLVDNFQVDLDDLNEIIDSISSIFPESVYSATFKDIITLFGLDYNETFSPIQEIRKINDIFSSLKFDTAMIQPILDEWSSIKQIFISLDFNPDLVEQALINLVKKENITIDDIFSEFKFNKSIIIDFVNEFADVFDAEPKTIDCLLKCLGVRETLLDSILSDMARFFNNKKIENEEKKKFAINASTFLFDTLGSVVEKIIDIVKETINPIIEKHDISFSERIDKLVTGVKGVFEMLGIPYEKGVIGEVFSILSKLTSSGIGTNDIEKFVGDVNDIILKISDIAMGKETLYNGIEYITKLIYSDDENLLVNGLNALSKESTTLKELLHLSNFTHSVFDFFELMQQMNNEYLNAIDYNIISPDQRDNFYEAQMQGFTLESCSKEILNVLKGEKLIEVLNFYKNQSSLISDSDLKVVKSADNIINKFSAKFKEGINNGDDIETSLHNALSSISKEESEPYITYVLNDIALRFSSRGSDFQEWVSKINTIQNEFAQSDNLDIFYNKLYEMKWDDVTTINDENFAYSLLYEISVSITLKSLIRNIQLTEEIYYIYHDYSLLSYILKLLGQNNVACFENIARVVDWITVFFANGTMTKYDDYYDPNEDEFKMLRILSSVLKYGSAADDFPAPACKFIYDVMHAAKVNLESISNKYSIALSNIFAPYYMMFKLLAKDFTNKDISNIVSEDINPESIAKIIDMFLEYVDSMQENTSLFEVFQKQTNFDGISLLEPIKEILNSLHAYVGKPETKYIQDLDNFNEWIGRSYYKLYEDLFNISDDDYHYTYYDGEYQYWKSNYTKEFELVSEKLKNKQFLNCESSEFISKLDFILDLTNPFKKLVDTDFTVKSFINCISSKIGDAMESITSLHKEGETILDTITDNQLGFFDVETTLENIQSSEMHNVIEFARDFEVYDESNMSNIIEFIHLFVDELNSYTVSEFSKYIGDDIPAMVENIKKSNRTFYQILPESGSLLSKRSIQILSDIAHEFSYNALTSDSLEKYIKQMIKVITDEETIVPTPEPTPEYSCGIKINYTIENKALTLSGIGATYDYNEEQSIWAKNDASIESIVINEGIRILGNNLFINLKTFTSVSFPSTLTGIGAKTFYGCSSLASIIIPESVTAIGDLSFANCVSLAAIEYKGFNDVKESTTPFDGISELFTAVNVSYRYNGETFAGIPVSKVQFVKGDCGQKASFVVNFTEGCLYINGEGITENTKNESIWIEYNNYINRICISEDITSIANYFFCGLTSVESVNIPESVTEIGDYSFSGLSISEVDIPKTIQKMGEGAFSSCNKISTLDLPDELTTISKRAFENCTSIIKITLPASLVNLSDYAFVRCENLETVTFNIGLKIIGKYAFSFCVSIKNIEFPSATQSPSTRNALSDDYKGIEVLGEGSFSGCSNLLKIEIPESVTEFGSAAFEGCTSLENVVLAEGLTKVGESAFKSCTSLANVEIPQTIKNIGGEAFSSCNSLQKIDLPKNLETIGDSAFASCAALKEITIPKTIETMGDKAFAECGALASVTLEDGLKVIGNQTFASCKALETITIPKTIETMGDKAFAECEALSSVTLEDGLKVIGDSAFASCKSLETITIPKTIETMGDKAFAECEALSSVTLEDGLKVIGNQTFASCTSLKDITIPSTIETMGNNIFDSCQSLNSIKLPTDTQIISDGFFKGCESLTSIDIPNAVKTIGAEAFSNCVSLTEMNIPNSVLKLGANAFESCSKLAKITLPEKLTDIGAATFSNCVSLTEMNIPNSVLTLGANAFESCSKLAKITLSDSLTIIDESTFQSCAALESIALPQNIKAIGNSAFSGCTKLESVSFNTQKSTSLIRKVRAEDELTIGDYAFESCQNLVSIDLPETLISIGSGAFKQCKKLAGLKFPSKLASIGKEAFTETALTEVALPESVTTLGNGVFEKCYDITSVTLSDNINAIPSSAFKSCESITTIKLSSKTAEINSEAFFGCISIVSITIPSKCRYIGENAFRGCSELTNVTFEGTKIKYDGYPFAECNKLTAVNVPYEFELDDFCNVKINKAEKTETRSTDPPEDKGKGGGNEEKSNTGMIVGIVIGVVVVVAIVVGVIFYMKKKNADNMSEDEKSASGNVEV